MADIENYYQNKLLENGFHEESSNNAFNPVGKLYSIPPEIGKGVYWIYGQKDLYDIKSMTFTFTKILFLTYNQENV